MRCGCMWCTRSRTHGPYTTPSPKALMSNAITSRYFITSYLPSIHDHGLEDGDRHPKGPQAQSVNKTLTTASSSPVSPGLCHDEGRGEILSPLSPNVPKTRRP